MCTHFNMQLPAISVLNVTRLEVLTSDADSDTSRHGQAVQDGLIPKIETELFFRNVTAYNSRQLLSRHTKIAKFLAMKKTWECGSTSDYQRLPLIQCDVSCILCPGIIFVSELTRLMDTQSNVSVTVFVYISTYLLCHCGGVK